MDLVLTIWAYLTSLAIGIINALVLMLPEKSTVVDNMRLALSGSVGFQWLLFSLQIINMLVPVGPLLSLLFWYPAAQSSSLAFRASTAFWRMIKW